MKAMRPTRLAFLAAPLLAVTIALAIWVVATGSGTFEPEVDVELSDYHCDVNADITTTFNLPGTDYNYAKSFAFTPVEFFPDEDVPIGAKVGRISATFTLGLLNGPCSASLPLNFGLLWASTDTSCFVPFDEQFTDGDGNGLHDGIDCYPDFLARMFPGLTPVERQYGDASVAGSPISINIVVFEAGALPGFPASMGRPSVIVLNNIGDPAAEPQQMEAISDFCTPVSTEHTKFGLSQDNPATDANEAGFEVRRNPQYGGTYTFRWYAESMRDADGDGFENCIDNCPLVANPDQADQDNDGIGDACEPDPTTPCWPGAPGVFNDCDNDFFYNRGDNCPLVANDQADADGDCIGDACDPNPTTPDGTPIVVTPEVPVEIECPPPVIDYGVTSLVPSELSFPNPGRFGFKLAVYHAKVQNFGAVPDGPAPLSLRLEQVNKTCPLPFVFPISRYRLTLDLGDQTQRAWLVFFSRCGDPSPPVDYIATARVSAPGDGNPGNDALTATVDVRKSRGPW